MNIADWIFRSPTPSPTDNHDLELHPKEPEKKQDESFDLPLKTNEPESAKHGRFEVE